MGNENSIAKGAKGANGANGTVEKTVKEDSKTIADRKVKQLQNLPGYMKDIKAKIAEAQKEEEEKIAFMDKQIE